MKKVSLFSGHPQGTSRKKNRLGTGLEKRWTAVLVKWNLEPHPTQWCYMKSTRIVSDPYGFIDILVRFEMIARICFCRCSHFSTPFFASLEKKHLWAMSMSRLKLTHCKQMEFAEPQDHWHVSFREPWLFPSGFSWGWWFCHLIAKKTSRSKHG